MIFNVVSKLPRFTKKLTKFTEFDINKPRVVNPLYRCEKFGSIQRVRFGFSHMKPRIKS